MPTEIYKFQDQIWQPITEIQYLDDVTPRDITDVYYKDPSDSTWKQVFGSTVAAEVLDWAIAAPTGTYTGTNTPPDTEAEVRFTADVLGGFLFTFDPVEGAAGGETSGTYRPGLTGIDTINYEISITAGAIAGTGVKDPIGAGTLLDGTWQPLDVDRGVRISIDGAIGSGSMAVTVTIREKSPNEANITAVASFTLRVQVF